MPTEQEVAEIKALFDYHKEYLLGLLRDMGWYEDVWRLPRERRSEIGEIREWCNDQFGPELSEANPRAATWMVADLSGQFDADYCFKTASMAVAFRLRWA